ncbi:MAG: SH3 domain-containing protein [Anaerolineae bacterium]|nr:SH3 domain-containing protein [Anaerolineae bacterium]
MRTYLHRVITLLVLAALAWGGTVHVLPTAQAQSDDLIQYNTPVIVTLAPGQTIIKKFDVAAGDDFELRLTPLSGFAYTAVLLDPGLNPTPLLPGEDGSASAVLNDAPAAGTYSVLMQAGGDQTGDLLVQVNSGSGPGAGSLGVGTNTLDAAPGTSADYLLPNQSEIGSTAIILTELTSPGAPSTGLPALTLTDNTTGEVIFSIAAGILPSIYIQLPATADYTLTVTGGDTPTQVQVNWVDAPEEPTAPELPPSTDAPPDGPPPDGPPPDSPPPDSPPSDAPPEVIDCQITITGNNGVNLRSGPGLEYNPPVASVSPGAILPVLGRSADSQWFQVNYDGLIAWIAGNIAATQTTGNCLNVPVVQVPPPGQTASATPTSTPGGPSPTATFTATVTFTPTITFTPTATFTPGGPTVTPVPPTNTLPPPTATHTPTNTVPAPTATNTVPAPTATNTLQPPTVTYTPSYTPTTPPAAPVAPEDARFNNPLNLPLDSTASVTDFVSYPGGDREDRVRWDITGMNSNSALSGGRARLTLAVSCFGTNTDQVQFFTNGQTFSCGQTIVDREVTFDSRTGSVVITAVGGQGTYVQWVLTGTAVRVN